MNNKYKFSCNHRLETLYFLSSIYCKRLEFTGEEFYAFSLMKFPFETAFEYFNNKIKNRIGQLNLKLEIINKYEFPQTFMQSSFRNIGTELYISLFSLRQKWIHKQGEERERGRQSLQPSSPIERTFTFLQKKIHHLHPLCSDRNYTCSPAASDTAPSDPPRFFPYHRPVPLSFLPSKNTILLPSPPPFVRIPPLLQQRARKRAI